MAPPAGTKIWALPIGPRHLLQSLDRSPFVDLLTPEERAEGDAQHYPGDRMARHAARLLLRFALAEVCGGSPAAWRFARDRWGRPLLQTISPPGLSFAVSRLSSLTVVAIATNGAIGIDIETTARLQGAEAEAATWLTGRERESIRHVSPADLAEALATRWTLKEAYVKAVGLGLHLPPNRLDFELDGRHPRAGFLPQSEQALWRFERFTLGQHIGAIAHRPTPAARSSDRPAETIGPIRQ